MAEAAPSVAAVMSGDRMGGRRVRRGRRGAVRVHAFLEGGLMRIPKSDGATVARDTDTRLVTQN
jgi:hypothetical protein